MNNLIRLFCVSIVLAFPGFAQETPRDLRDLVGARASSGESQLRSRGFAFVKTEEGGDRKWSNWWNNRRNLCITVVTMNGRYNSIVDSLPFDCNRGNNAGGGSSDRQVDPPSWAVGRFYGRGPGGESISLVITDLGHVEADVNGGISRGMFITGDRININGAVARVTRQRNGILTTRVDNGERITYSRTLFGGGGNQGGSKVDVSDLVGARGSSGERELQSRGFRNVDGFKTGNTSYTIWWRRQSRQCIQVATANGRYDSLVDIGQHPRCN
ncbi:MAG: hypothetical protein AB7Q37_14205 [Pyrinomonadaceae bacterium]